MLTILFFVSVFSSLTWVVYIILYLNSKLAGNDLSSLPVSDVALYIGLIIAPVWAVWQLFGLISQHKNNLGVQQKLLQLHTQMKKNQDYTDLVVRVMLDAEHEIKDGFVINKFDVFIDDMNEILADIVQRCNAASSMQMEQLWNKVKNGERWAIAKRLVETSKNYEDFSSYLAEKSRKDVVFKGTLLEFCYRYQNLTALLEKHDRERTFITILETGVMGKAYTILAPVVDSVDASYEEIKETMVEQEETMEVSPKILEMKEPEVVDNAISKWKKFSLFKKTKSVTSDIDESVENDEFFAALEKSMNSPEEQHKNYNNDNDEYETFDEDLPRLGLSSEQSFDTDFSPRLSVPMDNIEEKVEPLIKLGANDEESYVGATEEKNEQKEDNFAYPFGGWINEENYKK